MAGCKSSLDGEDFYGAYDAQDIATANADKLGVTAVPSLNLVYTEEADYCTADEAKEKDYSIKKLSGTKFRQVNRSRPCTNVTCTASTTFNVRFYCYYVPVADQTIATYRHRLSPSTLTNRLSPSPSPSPFTPFYRRCFAVERTSQNGLPSSQWWRFFAVPTRNVCHSCNLFHSLKNCMQMRGQTCVRTKVVEPYRAHLVMSLMNAASYCLNKNSYFRK
jgi:hypothetical protein